MKKFAYFILFILPYLAFGQNAKQLMQYADENFELGDYYGASIYYKKAMQIDSSDIHLTYKYATSLRLYNNYTAAEYYYARIVDKDKGGRIYPDASFWLGIMQKCNADYKEARKSFKKAKSTFGRDKDSYEYLKSKQEVSSCSYARKYYSDSIPHCTVKNAGTGINTTNSEFGAFPVNDHLYYSSLRSDKIGEELEIFLPNDYKISIYEAEEKVYWETKSKLASPVNAPALHSANGCLNSDKTKLYFTQCDSLNSCKLYCSEWKNGKWTSPKVLPDKVNDPRATRTTQPNVAAIDGKEYLLFVSDRPEGEGDLDIWFCEILDAGTFGPAKNLGPKINTLDPDITPFYHSSSQTLYFSSSWHKGFGGFDIFKSKGTLEELSEPENLLAPINTQWNDLYYVLDSSETKGYLTSNRLGVLYKKGPTCCNDIWEVKFNKPEEVASTEIKNLDDLNKFLPVTLYFHNDRPGPRSLDTAVKDNYLATYDKYKALQGTYREEYSKGLEGDNKDEAILDIDDYFKNYVDKGVDDLELFTKLLLKELEKGEKIEVTIKGFASPLAKTDYNVNLTKRRISTLINYLREYGNGEFNPYIDKTAINGGELTFLKIPFGEYTANANVSDDYYDQRNSIYNRSAALERKIEIQSVTYAEKDSIYAGLTVASGTFDFGKVSQGEIVKHAFTIENTGNKELHIQEVISECKCVSSSYSNTPIAPGKSGEVEVIFNTENLNGKQVKSITILADSFPGTKRLVLTAEIVE
ncbi:DUF1573 domain-containing protein [Parvicella tangerina]|uniref:DUF1573 domain-containing protein n=1 Tax=Parvicella tangerina TaxID=2829795 RepID=UPI00215BBAF3|nr:DUF1573 domain-containing protein [Parvicella tangerina]